MQRKHREQGEVERNGLRRGPRRRPGRHRPQPHQVEPAPHASAAMNSIAPISDTMADTRNRQASEEPTRALV